MSEKLTIQNCPKCGNAAAELVEVDTGTKTILQQQGAGQIPNRICSSCYNGLTSQVSQGVRLRIEQQTKEKNRHMVWKSRVNLIKHARQMMSQKAYSEAAVSYEKYIRVLEIAYDLKSGTLSPDIFGKSNRSKELTIIATTYWDLLRIYDTNPKYQQRMSLAARKLAEFLPYSPIMPDVVKSAQTFANTAKNPEIVRDFLKRSKASTGKCFIATAAFDDADHPVVLDLRAFRDRRLTHSFLGRGFISFYYKVSPPIAAVIRRVTLLQAPARLIVRGVHQLVKSHIHRP